jgi:hypothetical protein
MLVQAFIHNAGEGIDNLAQERITGNNDLNPKIRRQNLKNALKIGEGVPAWDRTAWLDEIENIYPMID